MSQQPQTTLAGFHLIHRWYPNAMAIFEFLITSIPWTQSTVVIYGRKCLQGRLTQFYGDAGISYKYSGLKLNALPWYPPLSTIRHALEQDGHGSYNSVLLNFYRTGKDRIGWHADDERDLVKGSSIVSLSLGTMRTLYVKPKHGVGVEHKIQLEHASLLTMDSTVQKHWLHCIKPTTTSTGPRISLTFRSIKVNRQA